MQNNQQIIYGCMGLGGGWNAAPLSKDDIDQANNVIDTAIDAGIVLFDHADIYTFGKAEAVFGEVMKQRPELREQMAIQTKCGIRFDDELGPKRYDFSDQWINHSVDQSLTRLGVEQIDTLILHRPDALLDVGELCHTLDNLYATGKVKHFGVSNMHPGQLTLLRNTLNVPIICNQVELSLLQPRLVQESLFFNANDTDIVSGFLPYCQQHQISVQSWGSLANGKLSGRNTDDPQEQQTAKLVATLAEKYQVSAEAILLGWIMTIPMGISPVIGTTNPTRIKQCVQANNLTLSREDWYALLVTRLGGELP